MTDYVKTFRVKLAPVAATRLDLLTAVSSHQGIVDTACRLWPQSPDPALLVSTTYAVNGKLQDGTESETRSLSIRVRTLDLKFAALLDPSTSHAIIWSIPGFEPTRRVPIALSQLLGVFLLSNYSTADFPPKGGVAMANRARGEQIDDLERDVSTLKQTVQGHAAQIAELERLMRLFVLGPPVS